MISIITVVHLVISALLILVVLLQHGKGADVGATFGGGANTVFGASGADSFLSRVTTTLALCFMLTSITLAASAKNQGAAETGILFKNAPDQLPLQVPVQVKPDQSNTAGQPSPGTATDGAVAPEPAANAAPAVAPEAVKSQADDTGVAADAVPPDEKQVGSPSEPAGGAPN